ncbi:EamA/RhaT family transporter [Actinobacteria bacterium IMCC26103]|nr:EamA/RhaT family transporter [Actinobacteria bacterium IMCC26103]
MHSPSPSPKNSWVVPYLALGAVWGCSFIFIKLGLDFLTPFGVAFGRCALGAMTLLAWAKYKKISLPKSGKLWAHLWVVSLMLNVIPGVLFALAETEVTSILAGIINAVTPLMTLIAIMVVTRDEKPKFYQVLGIGIGFIGVLTVLGAWQGLGDNPLWAILVLLAAVTCYGFSFPYSRRFVIPHKLPSESIAAAQVTTGALTLLPFFLFDGIARDEYRPGPVLAMLALGIFGSGFAYIWNFKIMAIAGSAIASSVTYITPIVAVIVGVVFLQESLFWYEPVGALIVLLGAAIGQNRIKLSKN